MSGAFFLCRTGLYSQTSEVPDNLSNYENLVKQKRVLIVFYTFSSQTRNLLNGLARGLEEGGVAVQWEQLKPLVPPPFPAGSYWGALKMMLFAFCKKTYRHPTSRQASLYRLGPGNLRRADLVIPSQWSHAFISRQLCRGNAQRAVCPPLHFLSELLAAAPLGDEKSAAGYWCQISETPCVLPSFTRDLVYAGSISETGREDTRYLATGSPTLLSQVWAQFPSD